MLKRAFDIIVSAAALLILSPVLLVVAWLIRCNLGSPVLFCQARPGYGGRLFVLIKFRSMCQCAGASTRPISDAERLTPFGYFLRSSSLDELPELWNVLKGDMSLVGPRPLLAEYLPLYDAEQRRRHDVRPGITGWAQVNGRNALSWEKKFQLDVWYVDHQSFRLDMRILFMTVGKVFAREGIRAHSDATMPRFRGGAEAVNLSDSLEDEA